MDIHKLCVRLVQQGYDKWEDDPDDNGPALLEFVAAAFEPTIERLVSDLKFIVNYLPEDGESYPETIHNLRGVARAVLAELKREG